MVMKKFFYVILALMLVLLPVVNVSAKEKAKDTAKEKVNMYIFYGDGCGYCAALHAYVEKLVENKEFKDKVNIVNYEVWGSVENSTLMSNVASYLGVKADGVPFYVIGDWSSSGFAQEASPAQIEAAIKEAYNDTNYKDVVAPFIRSNNVDNDSDFGDTDDTINENETDNNEDNSNDDKEVSNKEDKEDSNIISFSKDDLIEYGKYILVMLIVIAFIVILAKLFL
jgi:thiol-disulfide isomerase/thioredoxin